MKNYLTIVAYVEWCAKEGRKPSHIQNVFDYQALKLAEV